MVVLAPAGPWCLTHSFVGMYYEYLQICPFDNHFPKINQGAQEVCVSRMMEKVGLMKG